MRREGEHETIPVMRGPIFGTQLVVFRAKFSSGPAHDSLKHTVGAFALSAVAAFAYHKMSAKVVNSATAGLKFAILPELWLPIETVSR